MNSHGGEIAVLGTILGLAVHGAHLNHGGEVIVREFSGSVGVDFVKAREEGLDVLL